MSELASRRPYLIRAIYDWVLDNDLTPHMLIDGNVPGVHVPRAFMTDEGQITINVSPGAVRGLSVGNDWIVFSARFSGKSHDISVPPGAVLALYARENGEGMLFGEPETPQQDAPSDSHDKPETTGTESGQQAGRSHLRVIK